MSSKPCFRKITRDSLVTTRRKVRPMPVRKPIFSRLDPATLYPYLPNPSGIGGLHYLGSATAHAFPIPVGYAGFDPSTPAINGGEGFAKDLSGNKLPNAPPFTVSMGAQYSIPLSSVWAGTLRGDYYWQDYSWARVFNDNPYDRIARLHQRQSHTDFHQPKRLAGDAV